jgi:hypothetical protein
MRQMALLGHGRMTEERLRSIVESYVTSRAQWLALLPSPLLEQLNTLGTDGSMSQMDLIATLMDWYDTLDSKGKAKFMMMSLDFVTLVTPHGMPSRD